MFAVLHSNMNSFKSGPLHFTGQPYCKKDRSAKVKDGIINLFFGAITLFDTFRTFSNFYSQPIKLSFSDSLPPFPHKKNYLKKILTPNVTKRFSSFNKLEQ
jgi:hypothetical protein